MAYSAEDSIALESLVGPMMLDCPIPIASQGILWAAIEFCERTRAWSNQLRRTINAGTQHIALAPDDDASIFYIDDVRWDGGLLNPVTRQEAQDLDYDQPFGFYRPNPETLSLAPAASSLGVLSLTMFLAPLRNATSIPKMLYDLHWDAIEANALWRLMKVPNRPWSDPNQAVFYKQEFERLVGTYSIVADKDGTQKPLRVANDF